MNTRLSISSGRILSRMRETRPLVLSLTNDVVRAFTANLLLAVGAVPAMLADAKEAEEMIGSCASALLINTGTLTHPQADVMRAAVRAAVKREKFPWVLDPVAVGLLSFRTALCHELLSLSAPALIRGNASEILALAGEKSIPRGPESTAESREAVDAARHLAQCVGSVVLLTGATDYATDGVHTWGIAHGHPLMTRVTGVGCAMGALAAACAASADSPLEAAVGTSVILGLAGEKAAARAPHPGSFAAALLDELDKLRPEEVSSEARVFPV